MSMPEAPGAGSASSDSSDSSAAKRLDCPTAEIVAFARRVAREYGDVLSPVAIAGLVNAGFARAIPPDMIAAAAYGITWTECAEPPARIDPQIRAGIEAWTRKAERARRWDAQAPDRVTVALPAEAGGGYEVLARYEPGGPHYVELAGGYTVGSRLEPVSDGIEVALLSADGRGPGIVRLRRGRDGGWEAWIDRSDRPAPDKGSYEGYL